MWVFLSKQFNKSPASMKAEQCKNMFMTGNIIPKRDSKIYGKHCYFKWKKYASLENYPTKRAHEINELVMLWLHSMKTLWSRRIWLRSQITIFIQLKHEILLAPAFIPSYSLRFYLISTLKKNCSQNCRIFLNLIVI